MNNKRRCLACLPTKSVAIKRPTTARFLDDTRRIAGTRTRARASPPPQPQRHVLRSIGRPSGRKMHRRVRLAHASGERNRFGASRAPPTLEACKRIPFFTSWSRWISSLAGPPLSPFLFPFTSVRNVVARRRYSQIDAVSRLNWCIDVSAGLYTKWSMNDKTQKRRRLNCARSAFVPRDGINLLARK